MNFKKCICIIMLLVFVFLFTSNVYAADPTLVNKLNTILKKIKGYLEKLATPAAGVAIAAGVMIRKFSFGNQEKMILGQKVIINAIVGYGIILSLDLIIKFVEALI